MKKLFILLILTACNNNSISTNNMQLNEDFIGNWEASYYITKYSFILEKDYFDTLIQSGSGSYLCNYLGGIYTNNECISESDPISMYCDLVEGEIESNSCIYNWNTYVFDGDLTDCEDGKQFFNFSYTNSNCEYSQMDSIYISNNNITILDTTIILQDNNDIAFTDSSLSLTINTLNNTPTNIDIEPTRGHWWDTLFNYLNITIYASNEINKEYFDIINQQDIYIIAQRMGAIANKINYIKSSRYYRSLQ